MPVSPRHPALLILLAATGSVSAFSGGSPICHTDQIIGCPMGFPVPQGAGIFSVHVSPAGYTPGQLLRISIYPSDTFTRLNGLLLYVEAPTEIGPDLYPVKIGGFASRLPEGLKFGCGSGSDANVITHNGGVDHLLPLQFDWQAPALAQGTLRLRAIVLRAGNEFDWDNAPYEMFSIELPLDPVFTDSFE